MHWNPFTLLGGALKGTLPNPTLADGAVQSGAIGSGQIASGHLTSGLLSNLATTLASGSVQSGNLGSPAVFSGNVGSGQVGLFHLQSGLQLSGLVLSGGLGSGQVGVYHLQSGLQVSGIVNSGGIGSGQVGFGHLANASVQSGTIASGSIAVLHLVSGMQISGIINSGGIASGQVGFGHLANASVKSGTIAAAIVSTPHLASGAVQSGIIGVTGTPDGTQFLRDDFSWQAVSATVGSGGIGSGKVASGAVQGFFGTTRHIASGTVGSFDLGSGAITAGTIGSGAVQSGNVGSGQIASGHLASGFIGALGAAVLTSGQVTSGFIGNNAVTSGNIASGAVDGRYHVASGTIQSMNFYPSATAPGARNVVPLSKTLSTAALYHPYTPTAFAAFILGDPVFINANGFAILADASDPTKMPAVGVAAVGSTTSGSALEVVTTLYDEDSTHYTFASGLAGVTLYVASGGRTTTLGNLASGCLIQPVGTILTGSGVFWNVGTAQASGMNPLLVASGNITSGSIGAFHLASGVVISGLDFNNYLINGGMWFVQRRNSGGNVLISGTSGGDAYSADRWKMGCSSGSYLTYTRWDQLTSGFASGATAEFYGAWQNGASGSKSIVFQPIESVVSQNLANRSVNFQVKAKSPTSGLIYQLGMLQTVSGITADVIPNSIVSGWAVGTSGTNPTWGSGVAMLAPSTTMQLQSVWNVFNLPVAASSGHVCLVPAVWVNDPQASGAVLHMTEAGVYLD